MSQYLRVKSQTKKPLNEMPSFPTLTYKPSKQSGNPESKTEFSDSSQFHDEKEPKSCGTGLSPGFPSGSGTVGPADCVSPYQINTHP